MSQTIITPEAILSYPNLFTPRAPEEGKDAVYSCSLVFPAGTDLSKMRAEALAVAQEKFGDKMQSHLKAGKLRLPFREDGEEKGYPKGAIFITTKSKSKPGVVDRYAGTDGKPRPITDAGEVYAGCRVRASVKAFAYDTNGNKGVSFALNNIQKLGDGEHLDGRKKAEDEFEVVDTGAADLI